MLEFVRFINDGSVVTFMLLFFRFGALFIATPIFSHQSIPVKIKAVMAFVFSIVFFDSVPSVSISLDVEHIILAILSEIAFGLFIGLLLQLVLVALSFAGGIMSFMMGFSIASAIDPQNGTSSPIISQFLSLLALMVLLSFDFHHYMLLFIDASLHKLPLGGFLITDDFYTYFVEASSRMFLVGVMIAFPVIALTLLSDIIFGMIMKSMPQFNLIVIGIPIKIAISFAVLVATLSTIMILFKKEIFDAFNHLSLLF